MATTAGDPKALFTAALIAAKKAFGPLLKNRENPHFKSKYADLAALHGAVDDALAANGFLVIQKPMKEYLETTLRHVAGHEEVDQYPILPGLDPQKYLASVTYARRGSLSALLCIPSEDDADGNDAVTHAPQPQKAAPAKPAVKPPAPQKPATPPPAPLVVPDVDGPAILKFPTIEDAMDKGFILCHVLKTNEKSGERNGQPWHKYGIQVEPAGSEPIWLTTFSETDGEWFKTKIDAEVLCLWEVKQSGQYVNNNLLEIAEVENG